MLGWDLGHTLRLVTGLPSMTTEPSFRLAEIALAADPETARRLASVEIRAGMDVRATLAEISPRLADDFDRYLSAYGHRILGIMGVSDLVALSAGAVVPAARVVYGAMRDRSVDSLAVLVLLVLAASGALTFVSGDARFALAKESLFAGAAALWVFGTAVVGKPMIYVTLRPFATRNDPATERAWDSLWEGSPAFRGLIRDLTVVWGLAFLGDALLRLVVVATVPVKQAVLLVHVPGVILLVAAICTPSRAAGRCGRCSRPRPRPVPGR